MEKNEQAQTVVEEMPKVELHAHLNGSISNELLTHLKTFAENDARKAPDELPDIAEKGVLADLDVRKEPWSEHSNRTRTLEECWNSFRKIHEVIKTPRILYVATVNVIAEFSRDNVIYLELRTGAKKVHEISSKLAYVEAVIKGIEDGQRYFPIIVKLLISINRGNGEQDAWDNLKLAENIRDKYPEIMVGLDVSGDPNEGHWSWIVHVMQEARKKGFRISCHLPEIINPEEGLHFIHFGPERVGHGQFLHPRFGGTEELWELAKQKNIPIETCISSNLVSGVAKSLDSHIVKIFHEESVPYVICTDDSGVFQTSLSNEYKKLLHVVNLNLKQLRSLSLDSASYAFASESEKQDLTNQIKKWWESKLPPK